MIHPEISSDTAKEILTGRRRPYIWGAGPDAALYEWLRQIPAHAVLDTEMSWWRAEDFGGRPIEDPSRLSRDNASRGIVIDHHYYNATIAPRVEAFAKRMGRWTVSDPFSFGQIAAHAAGGPKTSFAPLTAADAARIDDELGCFLGDPSKGPTFAAFPSPKEAMRFFGGYDRDDYVVQALPALAEKMRADYRPRPGRIALLVGSLDYGGAERQIVNLAIGLQKEGYAPIVWTYYPTRGNTSYAQILADHGIDVRVLEPPLSPAPVKRPEALLDLPRSLWPYLWHMDGRLAYYALIVRRAIMEERPEALVSYLDSNNIVGGLGALFAGIPRVLLSGRNVAPTRFPHLFDSFWMKNFARSYPLLLRQTSVCLSNNSTGGAASYEKWLGLEAGRVKVVPNGVEDRFAKKVHPAAVAALRQSWVVRKGEVVILGVFRLSHEKRPCDFIQVLETLRNRGVSFKAILCGQGPEKEAVVKQIRRSKLDADIRLLGVQENMPLYMAAADLLLHTAEIEGSPNVILEAQAVGLPIVAAENSGTREYLLDIWSPYMKAPGRIDEMATACEEIIRTLAAQRKKANKARVGFRRRMGVRGLALRTMKALGTTKAGKATRT